MKLLDNMKWVTVLVIVAAYVSILFEWYLFWGILFFYWAIQNIMSGSAYIIEPIERKENPIIFWSIVIMWLFFGVITIFPNILDGVLTNPNALY